jgi:hypothetical protein
MKANRKNRGSHSDRKRTAHAQRYSNLTARARDAYRRSAQLVSDLRRGEGSYTELLQTHHLDARTARKYAGHNLLSGTRGRTVRASKSDRLVRELMFPTPFGDEPIFTRSSRDATKLSDFFQDRAKLLRGKLSAHDFETKWHGVRVAGRELFANAAEILRMANADVLKMEHLYASVGAER